MPSVPSVYTMHSYFQNFHASTHCYLGMEKVVYSAGSGPLVILLHEIPNPYPETFTLAWKLVQAGYTVHVPVFFGTPNAEFSKRQAVKELLLRCVQKEFAVFATGKSSPIVDWLRCLCENLRRETQQDKLAMIGMCLTGNFALGLLAEPWMVAPVLCQPSLPYALTPSLAKALHVDQPTLDIANQQQKEVLAMRFSEDWICPKSKFRELQNKIDKFTGIEIDSSLGNPHGISRTAHSVLTKDFVDKQGHPTYAALETLLSFLAKHLQVPQKEDKWLTR